MATIIASFLYDCSVTGKALGPLMGIIMLDTRFPRLKRDAGNPKSYSCNTMIKRIAGAGVRNIVSASRPKEFTSDFIDAAREIEEAGASAVTTTCGFMIAFQKEIEKHVSIPVLTSSLLQIPLIENSLPRCRKIGIITADSQSLMWDHLKIAGASERSRFMIEGMEDKAEFRRAILGNSATLDKKKLGSEVLKTANELVSADAHLGAFLLECTNLPPYSQLLRKTFGIPVFDFITMINWFISAMNPSDFQ